MVTGADQEWAKVEQVINQLMPMLAEAAGMVGQARARYHLTDQAAVPAAARAYIISMETHMKVCEKLLLALHRGMELMDD